MNNLTKKLSELVFILKKRDNKSFVFFEKILEELETKNAKQALEKLKTCYSITQYSNFHYNEEQLLEEIIEISNNISI